jgi:hypothetical protein
VHLLAQRHAIDKFHCHEVDSAALANLVGVRDVRMIESSGSVCSCSNRRMRSLFAASLLGKFLMRLCDAIECLPRDTLTHSAFTKLQRIS